MNYALILAGGIGVRMNRKTPKQFLDLHEKPLIVHTLTKFEECEAIHSVIVVCVEAYIDNLRTLCQKFGMKKVKWIVSGGDSRHKSILKGLEALKKYGISDIDNIIVHNANMPMVEESNIMDLIEKKKLGYDIVVSVAKCTHYFFNLPEGEGSLTIGPDRDTIVSAKAPEIYSLSTGLQLYQNELYNSKKYESYMGAMLGVIEHLKVGYCFCSSNNFKITTEDDFILMNILLGKKDE